MGSGDARRDFTADDGAGNLLRIDARTGCSFIRTPAGWGRTSDPSVTRGHAGRRFEGYRALAVNQNPATDRKTIQTNAAPQKTKNATAGIATARKSAVLFKMANGTIQNDWHVTKMFERIARRLNSCFTSSRSKRRRSE